MFDFVELLLTSLTQGKRFIGLGLGAAVGVIFTYPFFESFNFIFVAVTALIGAGIQFSVFCCLIKRKKKRAD